MFGTSSLLRGLSDARLNPPVDEAGLVFGIGTVWAAPMPAGLRRAVGDRKVTVTARRKDALQTSQGRET